MCRSRRELSNEYLLAKIGVDTSENEPLEVWGKIIQHYSFVSWEVTSTGESLNICEGLTRVVRSDGAAPAEETVSVDLVPAAIRLPVGTRLRAIVSGGAFPLYNRNLGLGKAEAEAEEMVDQLVTVVGGTFELPYVESGMKTP